MKKPSLPPPWRRLAKKFIVQDEHRAAFLSAWQRPDVRQFVDRANAECFNWDDCRHRAASLHVEPELLWFCIKESRSRERQATPFLDQKGKAFTFHLPASAQRVLHWLDLQIGGKLPSAKPLQETDLARWIVHSMQEEAVTSSLIEGAVVTRVEAQQMLRHQRPPRDPHEQMVLNNYRTIRWLKERRQEPLTLDRLREIQGRLTEKTLDRPDAAGRFRRPGENITVYDEEEQEAAYTPPPAQELPGRLETLCLFANAAEDALTADAFIHPVIRAILLHFALAYEHPFYDGNGRCARALFYWSMLRQGYDLAEYLSISSIIKQKQRQYYRAFLDVEQDENDLTYFIHFHLKVIEDSVRQFYRYIIEEQRQEQQLNLPRALLLQLNPRQQAVVMRAGREPAARFTYESHAEEFDTVLATARKDLLELEAMGLLVSNRKGRRFVFLPAADWEDKLRRWQ